MNLSVFECWYRFWFSKMLWLGNVSLIILDLKYLSCQSLEWIFNLSFLWSISFTSLTCFYNLQVLVLLLIGFQSVPYVLFLFNLKLITSPNYLLVTWWDANMIICSLVHGMIPTSLVKLSCYYSILWKRKYLLNSMN